MSKVKAVKSAKKNLVIVESASKAKTIEKYLSTADELKGHGSFQVIASMGHVVDLPPKEMGIDMETWNMKYVPIPGKYDTIQKLQKLVKEHDMIYLAADPDREGEAIAKNIHDLFKLRAGNSKRITFNEITKRAVTQAILQPREINQDLVDAQEARRILDRVVGYKLSPLLWRRFASSGLSAGRVQSVALKLIVDRAKEIETFKPVPVWQVKGGFEMGAGAGSDDTTTVDTKLEEEIHDKKEIEALMKELARKGSGAKWKASLMARDSKQNPSAPFMTSTLQQEVYAKYHIPAKRTMQLAQALYEAGHITYMRTDSTNLSEDAKKAIHKYIGEKYGENAVVDRVFKTKVANAQEAHECIRPTHVDRTSRDLDGGDKITADHRKVYDLIWRRTVASQMSHALYLELKTSITATKTEMPTLAERAFEGTARVLIEKGYLQVWQPDAELQLELAEKLRERSKKEIKDVTATDFHAEGNVTRPPSLYNEPSLVKTLEKESIGRPSTYATIIDKIFSKGYVSRGMNPQSTHEIVHYQADLKKKKVSVEDTVISIGGNETDRFVPTSLGTRVVDYLEETAPTTMDVKFTATMEDQLDVISNGNLNKTRMLKEFYGDFEKTVEKAYQIQKEVKKKLDAEKKACAKDPDCEPPAPPEKKPKNVLREITEDISIVQTRFGPALFMASEKRFASVMPFLKWREKTMDEITQKDARFLFSLPIVIEKSRGEEKPFEIALGRYGLYVKQNGENFRMEKSLWDKVYDGSITYSDVKEGITKTQEKASYSQKRKQQMKTK